MKKRVVITGLGTVNPLGNTVEEMWSGVKDGVCGIAEITAYDTSEQKVKLAGEVKNLNLEDHFPKKELRKMDKFTAYAIISAKEAFAQSGLNVADENSSRLGVIISSGIGGLAIIEREHSKALVNGHDRVSPFFIPMTIGNMAAGSVALELGFQGMVSSVVTACAGGTNAVGDGFRLIADGYADVMLCGGAESTISPLGIGGFTSMKALCEETDPKRGSIPFDKERSGFVMGEGAAVLMLEEMEHAVARGANIIAEVVGYGATCDAYHMTAPDPMGEGAAKCMEMAMASAGILPQHVDYINAHGTSTPMNDKCETLAVKSAFGKFAGKPFVSSTKSMTGHLLGASGAVEALICAKSLADAFVPATINYSVPDEDCDLNLVVNEGLSCDITYAMSNSLGFGGHNATVILKKWNI